MSATQSAAKTPASHAEFDRIATSAIPALRLHCYRLVGSLDDAEDMAQEALTRAWRHRERVVDPERIRPWLYRIATNACLDLLDRRRRHPVTSIGHAADWPEPIPDPWLQGDTPRDPAQIVIQTESIDLAFLTAVRLLPPRQRAILVLQDVLGRSASDVAEALGMTAAAVYSAIRRARGLVRSNTGDLRTLSRGQPDERAIARRYLEAWNRADVAGLADLLAEDARMAMPPDPQLFAGRSAIAAYFESILTEPAGRRVQLLPTNANGGPAFIVLSPNLPAGSAEPIGVKVLIVRDGHIAEIRGYMGASLASRFCVHSR